MLWVRSVIYSLVVLRKVFLLLVLITFPVLAFSFTLSKPRVFHDRSANTILVMLFVEGNTPQGLINALKKNLEVTFLIELKLIRKDFGILNIRTEVTNVELKYKIFYDFTTERYLLYSQYMSRYYDDIGGVFGAFYPALVKIDLSGLKGDPDLEEVYDTTEFLISAKAKLLYMEVKPPLNVIISLIGMGNYETEMVFSEPFKIK